MFFSKCECVYISNLNIETNTINKKYTKICTKHSELLFSKSIFKEDYRFSKKKKIYFLRKRQSSYENYGISSESDRSSDGSEKELYSDNIVDFGKYSGVPYKEVLEKDKSYCMNIVKITSRKQVPYNMEAFSDFINKYQKDIKMRS